MTEDATARYYRENAKTYADRTRNLDLSILRDAFLRALPAGASILDAGCGSGRDARAFLDLGYEVTAYDREGEMAREASAFLGRPVLVSTHQTIPWTHAFDGVWASASLVHEGLEDLPRSLDRLALALKVQGVLFASFRLIRPDGPFTETVPDGRYYQNMTVTMLRAVLADTPGLRPFAAWVRPDAERPDVRWVCGMARRVE